MKNEKLHFEDSIKELENIVKKLEDSDTGLDESIELYKKGIDLLTKCNTKLEDAELQITKLLKKDKKEN